MNIFLKLFLILNLVSLSTYATEISLLKSKTEYISLRNNSGHFILKSVKDNSAIVIKLPKQEIKVFIEQMCKSLNVTFNEQWDQFTLIELSKEEIILLEQLIYSLYLAGKHSYPLNININPKQGIQNVHVNIQALLNKNTRAASLNLINNTFPQEFPEYIENVKKNIKHCVIEKSKYVIVFFKSLIFTILMFHLIYQTEEYLITSSLKKDPQSIDQFLCLLSYLIYEYIIEGNVQRL